MTDKNTSKSLEVKRRRHIKGWDLLKYILLFIGAFAVVFPVIWMLFNSFKTNSEIVRIPPTFFPTKPTFENFINAWARVSFATYLRNTSILALSISAIICYTSAMLGYTLAKLKFWGRSGVFLTILISMMFPWSLTIIPLYKMMFVFHAQGTWFPLYFTTFFSAFGIFLMRQFCLSIPDDLIDAARIEGASEFRLFHRIILPMKVQIVFKNINIIL